MNKIVLVVSFTLIMFACQNQSNQTLQKPKTPQKESVERQADHSQTRFVLFQSDYDPKTTYQKMKSYLEEQGMFYPRVVDHETAAKNANMELNTIYLVVFGNPKMGTLLMQENPEVGIELPLKALIYKDDEGRTWVMYKKMDYLKDLYFIKDPNGVIEKMNKLQAGFKQAVINPIKTTQITDEEMR